MWHTYRILAHKDKIEQIKRGEFSVPTFACLQLCYACNQNCRSCGFAEWNKGFIPKEEYIFQIVNELMDYGIRVFEFSGAGEPTLMPYLEKLIRYIIEKGCDFSLLTNGVAIERSLIEVVAQKAIYCRVSLETGDRLLYRDYKRVPEWHFDKAVENIKQLVELKHPDTEISVKFDLDHHLNTKDHIKQSFKLATQLGVDLVVFKSMSGETKPSETEKMEVEYELNQLIKNYTGKTKFINSIYYEKQVPQCWLNALHTVADGYGDVYICCYYYGHPRNHCLGNLFDRSFKEIWESQEHWDKIKNIRKVDCAKFDCKFFGHHKIVDEALKKGRVNII